MQDSRATLVERTPSIPRLASFFPISTVSSTTPRAPPPDGYSQCSSFQRSSFVANSACAPILKSDTRYVLFSPLTRSSSLPLFLLGRASRGKLNEKGKKRYDDQDVRTRSTPLDASSTFFHAKKSTGGGGSVWLRNSQQESSAGEVCGPIKNIPGFFVSTAAPLMGSTHQGTRTRVSRYIHSQLERGNLN